MLVLTRRVKEAIVIGDDAEGLMKVTVLEIVAGKVRLGFDVNRDVPVHSLEVWERIQTSGQKTTPLDVVAHTAGNK